MEPRGGGLSHPDKVCVAGVPLVPQEGAQQGEATGARTCVTRANGRITGNASAGPIDGGGRTA